MLKMGEVVRAAIACKLGRVSDLVPVPANAAALLPCERSRSVAELSVLLLTRYDRIGASSRLRFYDYISVLERSGIRVTVKPFFDEVYVQMLYRRENYGVRRLLHDYAERLTLLLGQHSC